jgi:hypothetical protein
MAQDHVQWHASVLEAVNFEVLLSDLVNLFVTS